MKAEVPSGRRGSCLGLCSSADDTGPRTHPAGSLSASCAANTPGSALANRPVQALFLIRSHCSSQINARQYALSGAINNDGFPLILERGGLHTWVGSSLPPPAAAAPPWDSSGHQQAVSWVWANPHVHPCTRPVSSGLSLDLSMSLPERRVLRGVCQDETGSWVAMYVDATDVCSEAKGTGPPAWECTCVLWRKLWASYCWDPAGITGTVAFSWQRHRMCVSVPGSQAVGSLRLWTGAESPPHAPGPVCAHRLMLHGLHTVQHAAGSRLFKAEGLGERRP